MPSSSSINNVRGGTQARETVNKSTMRPSALPQGTIMVSGVNTKTKTNVYQRKRTWEAFMARERNVASLDAI